MIILIGVCVCSRCGVVMLMDCLFSKIRKMMRRKRLYDVFFEEWFMVIGLVWGYFSVY